MHFDKSIILNKATVMNLHNHTTYSDGKNTAAEVIENALQHGVQVVGISDHMEVYPDKKLDIPVYAAELNLLKEKYKGKIEILLGFEMSIFPYPVSFTGLDQKQMNMLDYVLIEDLDFVPNPSYLENLSEYLSRFHVLFGLAHTSFSSLIKTFGSMEGACEFLVRNKLFWEINTNPGHDIYYRLMADDKFREKLLGLFEYYKVAVSVGSDTHSLICYNHTSLLKANEIAVGFKHFSYI